MARSYSSMASVSRPPRSHSRAAMSASAPLRPSPGDGIVGKVLEPSRDVTCIEHVHRRQELHDCQYVTGICHTYGVVEREGATSGLARHQYSLLIHVHV